MHQEGTAIGTATPKGEGEAIPETRPPTEHSQPAEDWRFGFANSFRKAVDSIDRKLQGRISFMHNLINRPAPKSKR